MPTVQSNRGCGDGGFVEGCNGGVVVEGCAGGPTLSTARGFDSDGGDVVVAQSRLWSAQQYCIFAGIISPGLRQLNNSTIARAAGVVVLVEVHSDAPTEIAMTTTTPINTPAHSQRVLHPKLLLTISGS